MHSENQKGAVNAGLRGLKRIMGQIVKQDSSHVNAVLLTEMI